MTECAQFQYLKSNCATQLLRCGKVTTLRTEYFLCETVIKDQNPFSAIILQVRFNNDVYRIESDTICVSSY